MALRDENAAIMKAAGTVVADGRAGNNFKTVKMMTAIRFCGAIKPAYQ